MSIFQMFAGNPRGAWKGVLFAGVALSACSLAQDPAPPTAASAGARAVTVVAFGDMPYRAVDFPAYEALLDAIGAQRPDITINVGDIKGGGPCDEAIYLRQRDYMNSVAGPLVYTPGDNEWTDCHRPGWGDYDPRERLSVLRTLFFPTPKSLGRAPIDLERQADLAGDHGAMVENVRWRIGGALFATAHVVGSNNGLRAGDAAAIAEYEQRDAANVAWINELFAIARTESSMAVVLAFQADPFLLYGLGGGFRRTVDAIETGAAAYGGPVLIIHGDGHVYTLDNPFHGGMGGTLENVLRVEVPGALDFRAVRIRIDPDASTIFDVALF